MLVKNVVTNKKKKMMKPKLEKLESKDHDILTLVSHGQDVQFHLKVSILLKNVEPIPLVTQ